MRTRIKFCGLTRAVDVDAAVMMGADAVGFVCYPKSPRYVAPDTLAQLAARLPAFVMPVLLFVNESSETIEQILDKVPNALLQFHGDETPEVCQSVGRPYMRAVRVNAQMHWAAIEGTWSHAQALLADAPAPGYGGGGMAFDWKQLPAHAQRKAPLVLAGGLDASNVAAAIQAVRPYAVDVSSGIEDAPGLKSAQKMREFASAVLAADASI